MTRHKTQMYHIQEESKVNSAGRMAIVAVQQLVMSRCHQEKECEAQHKSAAQLLHADALGREGKKLSVIQ